MKLFLKQILSNKNSLKFISLMIGYTIWAFMGETHITEVEYEVPISFFNTHNNLTISAPENITLQLSGKRKDLNNIDKSTLALHIDAHNFTCGRQQIKLTTEQLLLPDSIKLVRWSPTNLVVTLNNA